MKIIGVEDTKGKIRKINKKKVIISSVIAVFVIIAIIIFSVYIANRNFRDFIDFYILKKAVTENNLPTIEIEENQNNIIAYDKYIAVLENNELIHYNSSGKEESRTEIQISNPIIDKNNRFLLIGEKDKQKLYLLSGANKVWEKDIEGNISKICVNKNGYTAVIISGTSYKSLIEVFDSTGKELFKTYLSKSMAVDVDISYDNKYMSFAEVNINGTKVVSAVKTVSIEKAKETDNSSDSTISTYSTESDSLILNIKYQESNKIIAMYDNKITLVQEQGTEELLNVQENSKNNFADIELTNYIIRVEDKSSFLNSESGVEIINIGNKKTNTYILDGVVKEIYCYDGAVGINLGSEVHFIGTNGWLIKKYTSSQEIKSIVINSNFAGIVYRNKIEIVKF